MAELSRNSRVHVVKRSEATLKHKLSGEASVMGLKFYVLVGASIGCLIVVILLILLWSRWRRNSRRRVEDASSSPIPVTLKEIIESTKGFNNVESEKSVEQVEEKGFNNCSDAVKLIDVGSGSSERNFSGSPSPSSLSTVSVDVPNMGWGRWYALRELEFATCGFSDGNVIGEGGYGVVYRGVFPDGAVVAVKNLHNKRGQAEKEFKVEVEAMGKVRHKNLVGLIGYCAEGVHRLLVYEYVSNGNLEQWLHGDVGDVSPLTWEIRMKIAIGTAKGLAYLHEGLEPKVVHRDIKSSNILLDKKWNAKVSDFGLAKLLGPDANYVTTRVMGTFGCVAPEYANTGMLTEGSDVYSFGVLLMELISGRSPVDYARHTGEVNLVDWFKGMVANRRGEEVVDPLIKIQPSPRALKRMLLVCLRCVDLNALKRPKMGQVVHMLEADEFPFRTENRSAASPNVIRGSPLAPRASEDK